MRNRQMTGVVVITLALAALMSTTAFRRTAVEGAAVVGDPPSVGACWIPKNADQLVESVPGQDEVPALDARPCQGERAGEVASVWQQRSYTQQLCAGPVARYMGLPDSISEPGAAPEQDTVWATTVSPLTATFGPDPLQLAAGQLWSACVVIGSRQDPTGELSFLPLERSVRGVATRGGAEFNRFASCSSSLTARPTVPCSEPHQIETFAYSWQTGTDEGRSMSSCQALVAELTAMSDPSAGGRLQTVLQTVTFDPESGEARPSTYEEARTLGGSVFCAVKLTEPDTALVSTLIGLRTQALPLR